METDNHDMVQVSMDEIEHDLPAYLQCVQAGEVLIVLKGGKPIVEIKPLPSEPASPRPYGLCAGEFTVPDDFDAPLPSSYPVPVLPRA